MQDVLIYIFVCESIKLSVKSFQRIKKLLIEISKQTDKSLYTCNSSDVSIRIIYSLILKKLGVRNSTRFTIINY